MLLKACVTLICKLHSNLPSTTCLAAIISLAQAAITETDLASGEWQRVGCFVMAAIGESVLSVAPWVI